MTRDKTTRVVSMGSVWQDRPDQIFTPVVEYARRALANHQLLISVGAKGKVPISCRFLKFG